MYSGIATRKQRRRTQDQMRHNAKTNVVPINIELGGYVKVRRHAKRLLKLQSL